jgi:TatD DNase family protein
MLIESHCHLDFEALSADLDGVVARAAAAGVTSMVTISTRVRQFDRITAIAKKYPQVWCSVGTHPHHAHEETDVTADDLLRLSAHPKCVAIGECGLDYHYPGDYAAQAAQFRTAIACARRSGLPVVVHARDADEDIATILEDESRAGPFPFVLHCFSSGADLARRGLALGGYVSFSGIVTFKNASDIQEIARFVPADRILVETDAPYLAPAPHRGQTNEPAYVRFTAEKVAELRGVSFETLAKQTTDNFHRLFNKVAAIA